MKAKEKKNKIFTVILWSLFGFIVLPLFIASALIAIQGNANKKTVPSLFGYMPMIITSGSMQPKINVGDLIFSKEVDVASITEENIISYWDPSNPNKIVTHQVDDIIIKDGKRYFQTVGIYTGSEDTTVVPEANVLGIYTFKIPLVGNIMLFAQSPLGLVMFLLIPLGAVLVYDTLRRQKQQEQKEEEILKLKEEINELKKGE